MAMVRRVSNATRLAPYLLALLAATGCVAQRSSNGDVEHPEMMCSYLQERLTQQIQVGMMRPDVEKVLDSYELRHTFASREEIGYRGETPFVAWEDEHVAGRIKSIKLEPEWPLEGAHALVLLVYVDASGRVRDRRIDCLRMSP